MTRRRLILSACIAVVALGAAWWYVGRLTAEEQRFVGTWQSGSVSCAFKDDHRFAWDACFGNEVFAGHWFIRDGCLVIDYERSAIRRALRPVAWLINLEIGPIGTSRIEWVTDDEVKSVDANERVEVLTRFRAD